MRLLLDTHALLWWLVDDGRLTPVARQATASLDSRVFVSGASGWEIATKHRLGKLALADKLLPDFGGILRRARFDVLPIALHHALRAGQFDTSHRDPFDRMLAAQSLSENLPLVSADPVFPALGVATLWS